MPHRHDDIYIVFGYDHAKKCNVRDLKACYDDNKIPYNTKDKKSELLVAVEKYYAEKRVDRGDATTEYLAEGFDPKYFTIPKLRQILSYYNVSYPGYNANSTELLQKFTSNIDRMRGDGRTVPAKAYEGGPRAPTATGASEFSDSATPVRRPSLRRNPDSRARRSSISFRGIPGRRATRDGEDGESDSSDEDASKQLEEALHTANVNASIHIRNGAVGMAVDELRELIETLEIASVRK